MSSRQRSTVRQPIRRCVGSVVTELQREFPLHVVCSRLGNSPQIAQQSYLLVTEYEPIVVRESLK